MSLSDANKIQENSGTNSTGVVTLGSNTTPGNTLIVITYHAASATPPSGFIRDSGDGTTQITFWRKPPDQLGAESSWTFPSVTTEFFWYVVEYSNIDAVEPVDVSASSSNAGMGNGGTLSTGTTSRNAGLSVLVLAGWGVDNTGSWDSQTNGFVEVADVNGSVSHMAVAEYFNTGTTGTFSSTATNTTGQAAQASQSRIVAYRAADAPLAAPIFYGTGFGWGTPGGMANTGIDTPHGALLTGATGTWNTQYTIGSSYARYSGYGLHIAVSSASSYVALPSFSALQSGQPGSAAFGLAVRVVSATGVAHVAEFDDNASTNPLKLVYNGSTNKFGLQWGSGTVQYAATTTALNTWVWIGIRMKVSTSTWHAEWRLETGTNTYTDQTSPADLTGQTPSTVAYGWLGAVTASTITVDYDAYVMSRYYVAYPLGEHKFGLLVPATTGASVVGTSTNFSKFTANGTLAAWGSDAGALLDEVPPTVSASADGVCQTAVAASDYMKFPMTDPTLASDEVFAYARAVVATWGGTGTGTGTLWLAVYDGTTETVIDAGSSAYDGDSLTAVSSTYPIWRSKTIPAPAGGWTLTAATALEARGGKSSDATPDMGFRAFYIEYAVRKASTVRQFTLEDPISATADIRVNPYTSASVSYLVTNNDATRSVNFNYTGTGTPSSPVTVGPSSTQEVTVTADAFGDIPDASLEAI